MSTPPLQVSVAMCTHNGELFIGAQIRSILYQTLPPNEVVLSDDASIDGTVAIAQQEFDDFQEAHPDSCMEFRIVRNPEALGVTGNFTQALSLTRCELIALSDQDDVWDLDRLRQVAEIFIARPSLDLLHGNARLIDGDGKSIGSSLFEALEVDRTLLTEIHQGRAISLLMRRNLVTGATTVLRRKLLADALPIPDGWVHDEWLGIVAAATGEIDVVEASLIQYRQHTGNQIGARQFSIGGKIRRMVEPGSERSRRLLTRAEGLAKRFSEGRPVVSDMIVSAAHRKLAHEEFRNSLPTPNWARVLPLLRECRSGRYAEFGRGALDIARDLLQPLRRLG